MRFLQKLIEQKIKKNGKIGKLKKET